MSTHRNRVQMTVSGTPGTGTITLGSASSGYQSFATAYGADATVDILIVDGTAWEVARDCTYTNSGTTVTRGTFEASSTGSAINLTSAAIVSVIATADRGRTWDSAALNTQIAGTDANTTMTVNTLYTVDMSAWATADRTYTLPAVAAIGDRVGIMVTAGNASFELIITAASGDTLNGVTGGTEWSRLFITGEVVILRCVVANTTWIVEEDQRIPSYCFCNTNITTVATFTSTVQSQASATNPHGMVSGNNVIVRRAGRYLVGQIVRLNSATAGAAVRIDTSGLQFGGVTENLGGGSQAVGQTALLDLAVGASRAFNCQTSVTGTVNCHTFTLEQL